MPVPENGEGGIKAGVCWHLAVGWRGKVHPYDAVFGINAPIGCIGWLCASFKGLIAGKPAPTERAQVLRPAEVLWELACRRGGQYRQYKSNLLYKSWSNPEQFPL